MREDYFVGILKIKDYFAVLASNFFLDFVGKYVTLAYFLFQMSELTSSKEQLLRS